MLLAKELGEITQIWNVSNNHKEIAHSKGLYSIFDENLTEHENMLKNGYFQIQK